MLVNFEVVSMAFVNAASASARDMDFAMRSFTSRWIWWLACVDVMLMGCVYTSGGACVMNCGGENCGGIMYPPECWEEEKTCIGGDEVGGSIVGEGTLVGGVDDVRSKFISVTNSLTEFIRYDWNCMNLLSRSFDIFRDRTLLLLVNVSFNSILKLIRISLLRVELLSSIVDWNLSVFVSNIDNSLAWSLVDLLFLSGGEDFDFSLLEEGNSVFDVRSYEI